MQRQRLMLLLPSTASSMCMDDAEQIFITSSRVKINFAGSPVMLEVGRSRQHNHLQVKVNDEKEILLLLHKEKSNGLVDKLTILECDFNRNQRNQRVNYLSPTLSFLISSRTTKLMKEELKCQ
eukprot:c9837_g1_i2 orf=530-898(-)